MDYPELLSHTQYDMNHALTSAIAWAKTKRYEYLTPEMVLMFIVNDRKFMKAFDCEDTLKQFVEYMAKYVPQVPEELEYDYPEFTGDLIEIINTALFKVYYASQTLMGVTHFINAMLERQHDACKMLYKIIGISSKTEIMSRLVKLYPANPEPKPDEDLKQKFDSCIAEIQHHFSTLGEMGTSSINSNDNIDKPFDDYVSIDDEENDDDDALGMSDSDFLPFSETNENSGKEYLTCVNDLVASHNPLIGRKVELARTIQVLCRKDKNNPLHIGEPGVGKTAIVYGLAALIESGNVPDRIKGMKIYMLDLAGLMAGTQFRGDMEKRVKDVLNFLEKEKNVILYIDEIHNVIGAGATGNDSLDVSNILKPYLENGSIRFMGATTYDEYKRNFSRSKAFARRFEKIDINEPSIDECILILKGIQHKYEEYHNLLYTDEAIEYAVTGAAKYITGRCLPDKAIDLLDEAGAYREMNPVSEEVIQSVDRQLIAEVLAKTCNVNILAEDRDDAERLIDLEERIKSLIYGQDKAVNEVTEAVQMATAGLIDDNKPMASLLFVGPTGVGKTEVVRVLAKELNLPLVRFDMSEYAEKHTVAKLIGSPAGYVGYEDGGLLTDAIRKSPHCVLLFDEIEKAHEDIYNILLQVMDYAVLTDNKGQKADFRHVIFVMTTNAGAQHARSGSVGFNNSATAGETMMRSVKKTFKPEFLNRLTAITIFNDMDRTMAQLILDKKLRQLSDRIAQKNVTLHLEPEARELLLNEGFSVEYGGREIDRVITYRLKPLLMRAILFGTLRDGGVATVTVADGKLALRE